jgi:hypothetical protein
MKLKSYNKYQLLKSVAIGLTALVGMTFGSQLYAGYYDGGHGHRINSYGYGDYGFGHIRHGGFYDYGYPYYRYSYNWYGPSRFESALYNVHPTYGKLNGGWRHLAKGNLHVAKEKFVRLSAKSPTSGLPNVGISLVAAFNEDHRTAALAMRRAFTLDPVGASDLPARLDLRVKIRKLTTYYRDIVNTESEKNVDVIFMYAALSHLLNDIETAQVAVQEAIAQGDKSTGAENLKKLLV